MSFEPDQPDAEESEQEIVEPERTRRRGRKLRRTPAVVAAICDVLRVGGTIRAACGHVGIESTTYYRWLEQNNAFREATLRAEAEAELRFSSTVFQAAQRDGDWRAAAWWLEHQRREDWHISQQIQVSAVLDVGNLMRENLTAKRALPEPEHEPVVIEAEPSGTEALPQPPRPPSPYSNGTNGTNGRH